MITLKPIIPKKFESHIEELVVAVEETINEADKQYARTYRTWYRKPDFKKDITVTGNSIDGSVQTSGEGSKDNPYPFIAKGTSVRYATMSPDFVSKTQPGLISSRQGRGKAIVVNKNRPRPGIKSRRWEEDIYRLQSTRIKTRINRALGRYVKKSGHEL